MFAFLIPAVSGACKDLPGYGGFRGHLEEKLGNPRGDPDAGADIYTGGSAAFLYISCNAESASEFDEEVGGWAKTSIHELIHVMQVQMLRGHMTTTTPPTDTLGASRFQVKNYHGACPSVYEVAIKGVLDALPAMMKLLLVPTYVIVVPRTAGGIGTAAQVTAAADELESILFPIGCASGVVLNDHDWWKKESNQIAEGEAEWYAANVLMAPGVNSYNDMFMNWNGAADWAQRVSENDARLETSKQLYHLPLFFGARNGEWSDRLDCLGWKRNSVGEVAFHFLKTVWRPATTHAEMQAHWITVYNSYSYQAGFETAFGQSWQQFVCDLETHYGIDRRAQTCAGIEIWPDTDNGTCVVDSAGDDGDDGLHPGIVALIVLLSLCAVAGIAFGLLSCFNVPPFGKTRRVLRPVAAARVGEACDDQLPPLMLERAESWGMREERA